MAIVATTGFTSCDDDNDIPTLHSNLTTSSLYAIRL